MKIPVVGMDPSFNNWGIAEAILDLDSGCLSIPHLSVIQPRADGADKKKVRRNSIDLELAEQLADGASAAATKAKVVFVEVPVGSQNARSMASYGICIGILGSIRAKGIEIIEVNPTENKKIFTGSKTASKSLMIETAVREYPTANWPTEVRLGKVRIIEGKAEHMADAIASIHAGVQTPMFQNLMRILKVTKE